MHHTFLAGERWLHPWVMVCAVVAGFLLSRRSQTGLQLEPEDRWGIALGAFCGAMIGAKIPFLFSYSRPASFSFLDLMWSDGKTIISGLAGGYFGVELAKWVLGVKVKTGDSFAPAVAVSIGIGRLGCYVGGCCYGIPTRLPWGVNFGDGIPRHPTQLYEFAFHMAMAVWLWRLRAQGKFRNQLMKLYIISYFVYRFLTEFIRPEPRLLFTLTGYQWGALLLIPIFAALWVQDQRALASQTAIR